MKKILCREDKPILQIQAKDGLILIAILELVLNMVVVDKELIGYFLMPDGADSRKELVCIKSIQLSLKELRSEDILVTERRCANIVDGITAHICQSRFPSRHEGIKLYRLQSHLLQENRILGVSFLLLEHEETI